MVSMVDSVSACRSTEYVQLDQWENLGYGVTCLGGLARKRKLRIEAKLSSSR